MKKDFKKFINGLYKNEVGDPDCKMGARLEGILYNLLCDDPEKFNELMELLHIDVLADGGEYFHEWVLDWGG